MFVNCRLISINLWIYILCMSYRAILAEALGSLLLFATVVGSGIMADRLAGGNVAVALLGNTVATGATCVLGFVAAQIAGAIAAHFASKVIFPETLEEVA